MSGHDQLKRKINPVPKRKLPLLITREQPPPPRSPTERHYGVGILGPRDVCHVGQIGVGWDGVGRRGGGGGRRGEEADVG